MKFFHTPFPFPCSSFSKRVYGRNHSYENDFCTKNCMQELVLEQRHKRTRKWPNKSRSNPTTAVDVLDDRFSVHTPIVFWTISTNLNTQTINSTIAIDFNSRSPIMNLYHFWLIWPRIKCPVVSKQDLSELPSTKRKWWDREGNSGRWPGYVMSTKVILNPAKVSFFWRKSVFRDVRMQFCLTLKFLVTLSRKTDFRSSKNSFHGHDISQGLDREPPSLSPHFLLHSPIRTLRGVYFILALNRGQQKVHKGLSYQREQKQTCCKKTIIKQGHI